MKKIFLFSVLLVLIFVSNTKAQTTITLQPDGLTGKDAVLHGLASEINNNFGAISQMTANAWTFNGTPGILRSVLQFDLSTIPPNSTITNAKLSLYAWDQTDGFGQHSTLSGPNDAWLERVTSNWNESTVTWNTKPSSTTKNRVSLPASTSATQNYSDINVTCLVQDMLNKPDSSFGFMLSLQNESYYRRLNFCTSDHSNASLRPKLVVTYTTVPTQCSVTVDSDRTICSGNSTDLMATGSSNIISYLWSNGATTSTINVSPSVTTQYSVIAFGPDNCMDSDTVTVVVNNCPPATIVPICIVSVDTSNRNIVVWNKPSVTDIDSFLIYKETNQAGIYALIGSQDYSAFSTFTDVNSNALQQASLYKLASKYTNGQISGLSDPHKTLHLTLSAGIGGVWHLIWNHYEGITLSSYNIYRGTTADNLSLLTTISSSLNSYSDLTPPTGNVFYQIEVVNDNGCSPAKKESYSSSKSNIVTNAIATSINNSEMANVIIYPNPNNGNFVIETGKKDGEELNAYVFNSLGQQVYESKLIGATNNISLNLNKGIYLLRILSSDEKATIRRVVVE